MRNRTAKKILFWVFWNKLIWLSVSVIIVKIALKEENSNFDKYEKSKIEKYAITK